MKIAISAQNEEIENEVDLRFGRATGFIIYDTETEKTEFVDNVQNLNAMQGAGIQAAQNVANKNVEAVITGHCGPKAFSLLDSAGIKIYIGAKGSVKECIEKFNNNELEQAKSADVEGHWV